MSVKEMVISTVTCCPLESRFTMARCYLAGRSVVKFRFTLYTWGGRIICTRHGCIRSSASGSVLSGDQVILFWFMNVGREILLWFSLEGNFLRGRRKKCGGNLLAWTISCQITSNKFWGSAFPKAAVSSISVPLNNAFRYGRGLKFGLRRILGVCLVWDCWAAAPRSSIRSFRWFNSTSSELFFFIYIINKFQIKKVNPELMKEISLR